MRKIDNPFQETSYESVHVIIQDKHFHYCISEYSEDGKPENLGALESLIREEYSDLSLCMVITEYGLGGKIYRYGDYWEEIGKTCGYA
jgi:hypothetical protein